MPSHIPLIEETRAPRTTDRVLRIGVSGVAALVVLSAATAAASTLGGFHLEATLGPAFTADYNYGTFGWSVAIDNGWIVTSAPVAPEPPDHVGGFEGVAWLFDLECSTWQFDAETYDSAAVLGRMPVFGTDVDLDIPLYFPSVSRMVSGAPSSDPNGAAQVWRLDDTWVIEETLFSPFDSFSFGQSVAIDGNTVVVGSWNSTSGSGSNIGAMALYHFDGAWGSPNQTFFGTLGVGSRFGYAVDMSGDLVVVGAPRADVDGVTRAGVVQIYERRGGRWSFVQSLTADHPDENGYFGFDVAIAADTIVVGAPGRITLEAGNFSNGAEDMGAAYVFTRDGSTWDDGTELLASDGDVGDGFGARVAIDAQMIAVSAPFKDVDGQVDAGKVYVFSASDLGRTGTLLEPDPAADNMFGTGLSMQSDRVVVGAPDDSRPYTVESGNTYVFRYNHWDPAEIAMVAADDLPVPPSGPGPAGSAWVSDWVYSCGVGGFDDAGVARAIIWAEDGATCASGVWGYGILPDLGFEARAEALGQQGEEIFAGGAVRDADDHWIAAVWERADEAWSLDALPMPPGGSASAVSSVNFLAGKTRGAAGWAVVDGQRSGAVWMTDSGEWQVMLLPGLPGGDGRVTSIAEGPDGRALLVGSGVDGMGRTRPLRWRFDAGSYQPALMPPLEGGGLWGRATAISRDEDESHTVIGWVRDSIGADVPVRWRLEEGSWRALALSTDLEPALTAITPYAFGAGAYAGPIVGVGQAIDGLPHAVLWDPTYAGGRVQDLAAYLAGVTPVSAVAMGLDGRIAVNLSRDGGATTFPAIVGFDACPADVDNDGDVGVSDLLILLSAWSTPDGDVTGDGTTDIADLLAVLSAWGACE